MCSSIVVGRTSTDSWKIASAPFRWGARTTCMPGHTKQPSTVIIYSLLFTCKLHGIVPQPWLEDAKSACRRTPPPSATCCHIGGPSLKAPTSHRHSSHAYAPAHKPLCAAPERKTCTAVHHHSNALRTPTAISARVLITSMDSCRNTVTPAGQAANRLCPASPRPCGTQPGAN